MQRSAALVKGMLTSIIYHRRQNIQLFIIPVVFTFCGFVGIAVTSAGENLYGEILWDPLTLIDKWDNRAAAFFAAFAFCLATIGTNISANSLCAGNDMTALYPKVLTPPYSMHEYLISVTRSTSTFVVVK